MINPKVLTPGYWKQKSNRGKVYFACFRDIHRNVVFMSRQYKLKATDAENRAKKIHARWISLYEQFVIPQHAG